MSLRSPKPLLATLLALTLGAAACGGSDSTSNLAAAPAGDEPAAAASAVNQLPDVDVIDVASGDEINLAGFAPSDKPIVLWFWAPH